MAIEADALALDLLEDVKPAPLVGLFNYKTWLDLMALSEGHDGSWRERLLALEPCVSADDLSAAKQAHADKRSWEPRPRRDFACPPLRLRSGPASQAIRDETAKRAESTDLREAIRGQVQ